MVTRVTKPTPVRPIINSDGTPNQEFDSWIQIQTDRSLIISAGSPEGVIEAPIGAEYMASDGTAGAIRWVKRDADDGAGDKTKGWISY
jgi:hypothetical protein